MPSDVIRFVDSIDASPTVRLDLNDEAHFWTRKFDAPAPRLRRSVSNNAMRDGIHVGSATYDGRTLTLDMETIHADQDLSAIQLQKLWRELDRPTNLLMYQPNGLTKPVFFRTFRSDASQLEDVMAQAAMRQFTIEVLAEPFALGLKETLGPYLLSNDPSVAGGVLTDVTGNIGDVPAPVVYWDSPSVPANRRYVAVSHTSVAPASTWFQAESMTLGTDTTNPGGGPDALMTGTGTNNYVRTSFATPAMTTRVTWSPTAAPRGTWRVLVFVRRAGVSGSTLSLQMGDNTAVSIPNTPNVRLAIDAGVTSFYDGDPGRVGYSSTSAANAGATVTFAASRSGGSDSLDWDGILLLPAGNQADEVAPPSQMSLSGGGFTVVDGIRERAFSQSVAGDPTTGAGTVDTGHAAVAGGFPEIVPNAVNRIYVVPFYSTGISAKAVTTDVTLAYWPRYKFVRPVSS